MNGLTTRITCFLQDEEGASAAEYGALATLIVLVCALAFSAAGAEFAGALGVRS